MRGVALIPLISFFLLVRQAPLRADEYLLPITTIAYTVIGPFQQIDIPDQNYISDVPIFATVNLIGQPATIGPPAGQFYGYSVFVSASTGYGTIAFADCAGNQGGICEAYYDLEHLNIQASGPNALVKLSLEAPTIQINSEIVEGASFLTPLPSVSDFELSIDLPDGFSIAGVSPVPEPSTWVMMILGLCGVGFMTRCRHKRMTTLMTSS